jgi:hypothetical protein
VSTAPLQFWPGGLLQHPPARRAHEDRAEASPAAPGRDGEQGPVQRGDGVASDPKRSRGADVRANQRPTLSQREEVAAREFRDALLRRLDRAPASRHPRPRPARLRRRAERLRATFAEVAQVTVPDDGVTLDPSSLEVGPIREGDETAVSASASRRASPPPSSASR